MPIPVTGIQYPNPRTWAALDVLTAERLRSDPTNLAAFLAYRPLFIGDIRGSSQALPATTTTLISVTDRILDNWGGMPTIGTTYTSQADGYYLMRGAINSGSLANTNSFCCGVQTVQAGVGTTNLEGERVTFNGVNGSEPTVAWLGRLQPADTVAMFGNPTAATALVNNAGSAAKLLVQWMGLGSGGVVVSSPQPEALWPAGGPVKLTAAIAVGATSLVVTAVPPGLIINGDLILDPGTGFQEQVTITSIAGTTIGISACKYPHGSPYTQGLVYVPISAAFMNQNVRDVIRFLANPPMVHLTSSGTAQSIATQTYPAATAIQWQTSIVDNFSGWSGAGSSVWTVPVSGVYYIYGLGYLSNTGTGFAFGTGYSINGGTTQYGGSNLNAGATARFQGCAVEGHVRLTAGQTIAIMLTQSSGGNIAVSNGAPGLARFIAVWRGF